MPNVSTATRVKLGRYWGELGVVAAEEACFLWRTNAELLRETNPEASPLRSLLELACDLADLYHQQTPIELPEVANESFVVFWLEVAANETLLVFLKPLR